MIERMLDQAQHNPVALWEILDDEVLWELGDSDIPDAGASHWRWPEGVREFFRRWVAQSTNGVTTLARWSTRATRLSFTSTSGGAARAAGRSSRGRTISRRPKPSKPWGCGSRAAGAGRVLEPSLRFAFEDPPE